MPAPRTASDPGPDLPRGRSRVATVVFAVLLAAMAVLTVFAAGRAAVLVWSAAIGADGSFVTSLNVPVDKRPDQDVLRLHMARPLALDRQPGHRDADRVHAVHPACRTAAGCYAPGRPAGSARQGVDQARSDQEDRQDVGHAEGRQRQPGHRHGQDGKASVTIPKLAKETWKVSVKFLGTSAFTKTSNLSRGSFTVKK
jgi:hypothetical protein